MTIQAGKYRHKITIRNAPGDSTRDSFGRRKGTGAIVAKVWAAKQDWQGAETTENGRETASVTTKWFTRYRTDVSAEMEVVHGSDVYRIISPPLDFDGMKRELVLMTRRVES